MQYSIRPFSISFACALALASGAFAQQWDTLYHSTVAVWVTPAYNVGACNKYKVGLDSIEQELDAALPLISTYLGVSPVESPQRVEIDSGTSGMGGWAGGGDVGYQISDFYGRPANGDGLRWIRGVVLGEIINATTGGVTGDWPRDWWADDVWYFPGFLAGEILRQVVNPTFADYWLTSEHYPTYPVYNLYQSLLKAQGWDVFKRLFAMVKADAMQWGNIGANPSKLKTDYVIAYLSLAAGRNLAADFVTAKVASADPVEVDSILYVERGLTQADKAKLNTTSAWSNFRKGDYAAARKQLDALGVVVAVHAALPMHAMPAGQGLAGFRMYSLTGQNLFGARSAREKAHGFYIFRNPETK